MISHLNDSFQYFFLPARHTSSRIAKLTMMMIGVAENENKEGFLEK